MKLKICIKLLCAVRYVTRIQINILKLNTVDIANVLYDVMLSSIRNDPRWRIRKRSFVCSENLYRVFPVREKLTMVALNSLPRSLQDTVPVNAGYSGYSTLSFRPPSSLSSVVPTLADFSHTVITNEAN